MKTVAKTLLLDKNGKLLILYRSETHPRYAHHPDLPGGEVEDGESPDVAASREIQEETGLNVEASQIEVIYTKIIDDQLVHIVCAARLTTIEPDIELSWEHENYEWITLEVFKMKVPQVGMDDYYLTVHQYVDTLPVLAL